MTNLTTQTSLFSTGYTEGVMLAGEASAEKYLAEHDGEGLDPKYIPSGAVAAINAELSRRIFGIISLIPAYVERRLDAIVAPALDLQSIAGEPEWTRESEIRAGLAAVALLSELVYFSEHPEEVVSEEQGARSAVAFWLRNATLTFRVGFKFLDGTYADQSWARVFNDVFPPLIDSLLLACGLAGIASKSATLSASATETASASARFPVAWRAGNAVGAQFGCQQPTGFGVATSDPLGAVALAGEVGEVGVAEVASGTQIVVDGSLAMAVLPDSAISFLNGPSMATLNVLGQILGLAGGASILTGDQSQTDLAKELLRRGLSIVTSSRKLTDLAQQMVEEGDLALQSMARRLRIQHLKLMGFDALAYQLEQELAGLEDAAHPITAKGTEAVMATAGAGSSPGQFGVAHEKQRGQDDEELPEGALVPYSDLTEVYGPEAGDPRNESMEMTFNEEYDRRLILGRADPADPAEPAEGGIRERGVVFEPGKALDFAKMVLTDAGVPDDARIEYSGGNVDGDPLLFAVLVEQYEMQDIVNKLREDPAVDNLPDGLIDVRVDFDIADVGHVVMTSKEDIFEKIFNEPQESEGAGRSIEERLAEPLQGEPTSPGRTPVAVERAEKPRAPLEISLIERSKIFFRTYQRLRAEGMEFGDAVRVAEAVVKAM